MTLSDMMLHAEYHWLNLFRGPCNPLRWPMTPLLTLYAPRMVQIQHFVHLCQIFPALMP
uniref:Uncharacterized protein n=1 Tax=Rhizophora mucronata TaxID=61149 RepID=A0A2P2P5W2_RHIMU